MPHPAQPQHTKYWAPRTRKRHQQEHRPQRPTESSDPTQHAKGRPGDRPGPRKGATTGRNVTQGDLAGGQFHGKFSSLRKVAKFRAVGRRWGTCPGPSRPARPGQPWEGGGRPYAHRARGPARVLLGWEYNAPLRRPEARPALGTACVSCPSEYSIELHVRVCMRQLGLGDSQG